MLPPDLIGTYTTKSEAAAEMLRELIFRGLLPPGTRLILRDLQKQLGLSVTPIREALQALQADGLVVGEPHRGLTVAHFNVDDLAEIYWLRGVLEKLAAEEAVANLTGDDADRLDQLTATMAEHHAAGNEREMQLANREFHMSIYRAAGHPQLLDMIVGLWRKSPWGSLRISDERPVQSVDEHRRIVAAVRAGDAAAAGMAMLAHIEGAKATILQLATPHPTQPREAGDT